MESHSKEDSSSQLCPATWIEPSIVADDNSRRFGLKQEQEQLRPESGTLGWFRLKLMQGFYWYSGDPNLVGIRILETFVNWTFWLPGFQMVWILKGQSISTYSKNTSYHHPVSTGIQGLAYIELRQTLQNLNIWKPDAFVQFSTGP